MSRAPRLLEAVWPGWAGRTSKLAQSDSNAITSPNGAPNASMPIPDSAINDHSRNTPLQTTVGGEFSPDSGPHTPHVYDHDIARFRHVNGLNRLRPITRVSPYCYSSSNELQPRTYGPDSRDTGQPVGAIGDIRCGNLLKNLTNAVCVCALV